MILRRLVLAALAALVLTAAHAGEAEDRKARSIAILQSNGVPVLDSLPLIKTEATSLRRTDEEVIQRMLALAVVAVRGETMDDEIVANLRRQFEVEDSYFSPKELAFLNNPNPSQQDIINATWRYEGMAVMMWSLGLIELRRPSRVVHVPDMGAVMGQLRLEGLRAQKLRPQSDILDAADLIYRQHWAIRQARLEGNPPPAALDPGVVFERDYALSWLIGFGVDWDTVQLPT